MFVDHLQLADFRSYLQVDVPLWFGVTMFVGANGQGKTNLVEVVEYRLDAVLAPGVCWRGRWSGSGPSGLW